jgi:hypothetical protein
MTSSAGHACYHSVQNLSSLRLSSKNVKIRICKTTVLSVVLYGCETWSLTLNKKLKVLEDRVLMRIFGPKTNEIIGGLPRQQRGAS